LIQREAEHARSGKPARLTFKVNSIADPRIIRVLYEASQAGVQIDLIVRGVCCLRPGVPEISENIRVHSIVGRFLEHSRIYSFENAGSPEVYIGSADLMERNLDRRVEVLTPVLAPSLRDHLREVVLQACLEDTECTFILQRDGSYRRLTPEEVPASSCVHTHLLEWYARRERERVPE
ncbi:MAG: RNA degradosome polyphosphate kinase, partial [bacterium]